MKINAAPPILTLSPMLAIAIVLGACSPAPTATPVPTPARKAMDTPTPIQTTAATPTPAATPTRAGSPTAPAIPTTDASMVPSACRVVGQPLFINSKDRYCLALPIQFKPDQSSPGSPSIVGPALDQSPDPLRAMMTIETKPVAAGTTVKQAVDAFVKDLPKVTPAITRKSGALGGEPAEFLENVPGRLSSRNVLVVHNSMLFNLYFQPAGMAKAQSDFDALYKTVTTSFAFLPDMPWAQAQAIIVSGLVTKVTQSHSQEVRLTLIDGRTLTTMEPNIDDVLAVIRQCGAPCSKVSIATE